jgi:DNA-binding transcriptional regulator YiaG
MAAAIEDLLAKSRLRRRLPDAEIRALLRQRAGVSQAEVADVVGVTAATVSRWESGTRTPSGVHLTRYLELLDELARQATRLTEEPVNRAS